MSLGPRFYWGASCVLLVWIVLVTAYGEQVDRCQSAGGVWDVARWRCDSVRGRILIDRGLKRSWAP